MKFSDTTNKNGIIQLSESLCSLGDAGISSDAVLLKQFTNYVNMAYWEIFMASLSVDSNWKTDDFNYTDYPEAPITMVNSQSDYTLPVATTGENVATLLRVNKVWVLDTQGHRLDVEFDPDQDIQNFGVTGIPTEYRLHGKSIYLVPAPVSTAVTLASGLIIQFQRTPDAFTSADTTQEPGFMGTYHDLLALKASAWYLLPVNPNLATQYEQRFLSRLELFKRDVAKKVDGASNKITLIGASGR